MVKNQRKFKKIQKSNCKTQLKRVIFNRGDCKAQMNNSHKLQKVRKEKEDEI